MFGAASGYFPQSQGDRLSVVRREDQFREESRVERWKGKKSDWPPGQIMPKIGSIYRLYWYTSQ